MKKTPKATPPAPPQQYLSNEEQEAIVNNLRKTVSALDTTIAIYNNDISRALQTLKESIGANSVEEALIKADEINQEMDRIETAKATLLLEIKGAMDKYSDEITMKR